MTSDAGGASVAPPLSRGADAMSQRMVEIVIARLLTDEEFRARFVINRTEMIVELSLIGVDLTRSEIDVLMGTDASVWFPGPRSVGERVH
jgi:hypothetical protein